MVVVKGAFSWSGIYIFEYLKFPKLIPITKIERYIFSQK